MTSAPGTSGGAADASQPSSEADVLHDILLAYGALPWLRLWRANAGAARTRTGTLVRFGVPGQADISGILKPSGRRIEIETKSATGRQRESQRRFQAMIEQHGGLYILARSVEDVRKALQCCMTT